MFGRMIKQLIVQSLTAGSCQPNHIMSKFKEGVSRTAESLLSTVEWISRYLGDVYVVIDGLDECAKREVLLSMLERISVKNMKLFITSRPENDIMEMFRGKPCLNMNGYNSNDIMKYVQWELHNELRLACIKPALKQEITNKFIAKSGGMSSHIKTIC